MYDIFRQHAKKIQASLDIEADVKAVFDACFLFTLDQILDTEIIQRDIATKGTAFVKTGDIPAMWLRDSAAQMRPYVPFAKADAELAQLIKAVIRQQGQFIIYEPYTNAFNASLDEPQFEPSDKPKIAGIWERKYELDSLCYPLQLCQDYWQATGDISIFDAEWHSAIQVILNTMQTEQHHDRESLYHFERDTNNPVDTLRNKPTTYTGMVWSGFRPSDDSCDYNYLIPANMFAVVVLSYVVDWIDHGLLKDDTLRQQAQKLRTEIEEGIANYGIYEHPTFGEIYAYEVDGYGNYNLMDDANIPSLLSMPYLGYCDTADALYQNTRRFILSSIAEEGHPFFYHGKRASGIGSPHTPPNHVWHLGLIMQALTAQTLSEKQAIVRVIVDTASHQYLMHESIHADHFDPQDPSTYTREEFGWANSLFAELILRMHNLFM